VGRYPQELRERAVRMVAEVRPSYRSQWAAMKPEGSLIRATAARGEFIIQWTCEFGPPLPGPKLRGAWSAAAPAAGVGRRRAAHKRAGPPGRRLACRRLPA
jgi:hypothetical protein